MNLSEYCLENVQHNQGLCKYSQTIHDLSRLGRMAYNSF